MSEPIKIDDAGFEQEVLKADVPVLVDFWAEWCGPCKMLSPMIDQLAAEYDGKLKVVKVNVDDNPQSPQQYGVRGIPTLMIFKGGQPEATKVGAMPKQALSAFVEENIA